MSALFLIATGLIVVFLRVQMLNVLKILLHGGPPGPELGQGLS